MPSSRKILKTDHARGDRLGHEWVNDAAQQINALSGVGDAVDVLAIGGGKFVKVKRKPPQVRDAVLTEDMEPAGSGAPQEDKSDFKFKFLYRDPDDADLLIEGNNEHDGVNRNAGLSGSEGDYVAVAWVNNEWRAMGGGGTSTTSLTDGCECDGESLVQGVPLSGEPTVCCTGHERFTIKLGSLGSFTLYHGPSAGLENADDTWSTFNEDEELDNPWVNVCDCLDDPPPTPPDPCETPVEDEYDVVMTLTATGATIKLEARDELNCDAVCFEYERSTPFSCQKKNQFNLGKFSGVDPEWGLPVCVCVVPAGCLDEFISGVGPRLMTITGFGSLANDPSNEGSKNCGRFCGDCSDHPSSVTMEHSVGNPINFVGGTCALDQSSTDLWFVLFDPTTDFTTCFGSSDCDEFPPNCGDRIVRWLLYYDDSENKWQLIGTMSGASCTAGNESFQVRYTSEVVPNGDLTCTTELIMGFVCSNCCPGCTGGATTAPCDCLWPDTLQISALSITPSESGHCTECGA